ncbi:MAG: chalcone isomerase family protein [Polaromonas sp.]|uniref:chalcone isomerase family protein n=1 Tax=Polaromonas sp. TaxID=1869339 RepID=UPI00326474F9
MHQYSRRNWLARGAATLAAGSAGLALPVLAAPTATKFPDSLVVQGTTLQLNGAGTRFKAIFKVYDMALYTSRKVTSADEAMKLGTPVRLAFVALREVSGTDLGRLFLRGMAENASRDAVSRHSVSSNRLIDIFSGRSKLMPGDSFAMEFVPGKGTSFFIAEQLQGAPVGDAEFFRLVLGIWLGSQPADFMLKDALLGIEKS